MNINGARLPADGINAYFINTGRGRITNDCFNPFLSKKVLNKYCHSFIDAPGNGAEGLNRNADLL